MCVCTLLKIYKVLVLNDPFSNLIFFFWSSYGDLDFFLSHTYLILGVFCYENEQFWRFAELLFVHKEIINMIGKREKVLNTLWTCFGSRNENDASRDVNAFRIKIMNIFIFGWFSIVNMFGILKTWKLIIWWMIFLMKYSGNSLWKHVARHG